MKLVEKKNSLLTSTCGFVCQRKLSLAITPVGSEGGLLDPWPGEVTDKVLTCKNKHALFNYF